MKFVFLCWDLHIEGKVFSEEFFKVYLRMDSGQGIMNFLVTSLEVYGSVVKHSTSILKMLCATPVQIPTSHKKNKLSCKS
jgi:hypothetical protein